MKKLSLHLEDLAVESFATGAEGGEQRTVFGRETYGESNCYQCETVDRCLIGGSAENCGGGTVNPGPEGCARTAAPQQTCYQSCQMTYCGAQSCYPNASCWPCDSANTCPGGGPSCGATCVTCLGC